VHTREVLTLQELQFHLLKLMMMMKMKIEHMILDKKKVRLKLKEELDWLEFTPEEFQMPRKLNTLTISQFINHSH
jgi:hypothetical protein